MTLLCVPIFINDLAQAKRDMARAAENGADVVELRIDGFEGAVAELLEHSVIPAIVTCRPTWEGGRSTDPDEARVERLTGVAHLSRYIDIELETLKRVKLPPELPARLIVSSHDFQGRPERLYNTVSALNDAAGDVNKIVWTARTVRDNLEAFELLQKKQKPTIALCMGEAGLLSRVLAKKFGGYLSFASLDDGQGTAPGQVTIEQMKRLYRWDSIRASTRVYGVVGSPVAHSMSPAIHNAAFAQIRFDGVYLPMLVNEGYESFKAFMESFLAAPGLDLCGLSITIPHKENALRFLKFRGAQVEQLAERIGAVNTIQIDREQGTPRLVGSNTDYPAILDSVVSALGIAREELAGYRVAVIGAGGTGRTAVAAFANLGATVVVYNRTRARAEALAAEFNGKTGKVVPADFDRLCDSCCQIVINTSSVGMSPRIDASPFDPGEPAFAPDTLVFDCIYNPIETKLLKQAKQAGARTVSGVEMFLRQAVLQFTTWTDKPAPVDAMRRVIETHLARS